MNENNIKIISRHEIEKCDRIGIYGQISFSAMECRNSNFIHIKSNPHLINFELYKIGT